MKYNYLLSKSLVFGIIIIFIFSSFGSSIGGFSMDTVQIDIDVVDDNELPNDVLITCSTFGLPGKQSHESSIPQDEAKLLYEKIKALQIEVARDPLSDTVHEIQNDIITIAKEHNLLPKGVSTDEVLSSLSPIKNANKPGLPIPRAPGRASEMFCNYVSTGSGSSLPIIILPRLIPILLTPIPRLFVRWSTYEGVTSCGGLRSKTGFIATGAQNGIALGFWGIGFSIFLSGSGTNKGNGIYTIPVSELQSNTQYQWIVEVADGKDVTIEEFSFMTEELPFDPFNEGWQYRKKITIDHAQVDGDLSYFPVLVSTLDPDLRDKAQDDGDDILFMNDDGVAHKLYHEIEHYDDSTGELVAWVNIPSVLEDEDTMFYMYYGNPACNSQQVPDKVWNINYVMVHHMNDKTTSSIEDSTIYDNDGIKLDNNEPMENLAKIGYGQEFDAVNDYIRISDSDSISVGAGDLTISVWIEPKSDEITVLSKVQGGHNKEYFLSTKPERQIRYMIENRYDDGDHYTTTTSPINHNKWQHIAVTFDADTYEAKIYHNGISQSIIGSIDELPKMLDDDLTIGIYGGDLMEKPFDGIIDEVRISDITRNSDWILTGYNNQNDPLSFLSFGPEEIGQ